MDQPTQQPVSNQVNLATLQSMLTAMQQPAANPMMPMQQPFQMGAMQAPSMPITPTGLSIPLNLPLPDGSTIHARIDLPPEALTNWPAVSAMLLQAYGQAIPRQRQQYGQGYGQSYGNGGYQQRQHFGRGGYGQGYGGNGYGQRQGGW